MSAYFHFDIFDMIFANDIFDINRLIVNNPNLFLEITKKKIHILKFLLNTKRLISNIFFYFVLVWSQFQFSKWAIFMIFANNFFYMAQMVQHLLTKLFRILFYTFSLYSKYIKVQSCNFLKWTKYQYMKKKYL